MTFFTFLSLVVVFHFVADYLFQSREIANNKSSSFKHLMYHIATYAIVLSTFTLMAASYAEASMITVSKILVLNIILHGFTDYWTSQATTYYYKKENYKAFFNMLGVDQTIHIVILIQTFSLLIK